MSSGLIITILVIGGVMAVTVVVAVVAMRRFGGQAEQRGVPIFVLRANTVSQMEQFLSDLFNLSEVVPAAGEMEAVKLQAQAAIAAVLNGERWVDLPPGPSTVRRLQHELARDAELVSHSYGKEPRRHVRIFRA